MGGLERGCSTTIKFNDGVIFVLGIEVSCGEVDVEMKTPLNKRINRNNSRF